MSTSDGPDIANAVLPAEIWNPDTETWTTVASLHNAASTTRRHCCSRTAAS